MDDVLSELSFTVSGRIARPVAEVYEAVTVVEAEAPRRIVLRWAGQATTDPAGQNSVTFAFEPIDAGARTLATITESSWQPTTTGAENAFRNCEGWTGMLAAMKVWLEHGIALREGFYD